jgi:D-alanine-D-alanine ligase
MKKNIAVVMGGYSSEIEISMQSGNVVASNLDSDKYNVYKVHILIEKWVVAFDDDEINIDKSDFTFTKNNKKIHFDCVFNAIHGNPGENGPLVAYLELLGIKHTTAPFYQLALTFNKRDTLSVLKDYNIDCAKSMYLNKGDEVDTDSIVNKLGLPCFVKPNNAGSSYGISKVYKKENLLKAIDKAYKEDNEILIESFLDGIEVQVGAIQYQGKIKVLPTTEIVSENDFFDYEAKYLGKSEEITPARISKNDDDNLKQVALKIYKILNMRGMVRADFILVNSKPYFIEINTVPGMTTESIIPKQARAAGFTLKEFFGNAIESALD